MIKAVLFCREWTRFCGDSCVLSSANDMARFMIFLLGNGTAPGSMIPLVSDDEFSNMFKPWNRLQSPSIEEYFSKAQGVPVSRTHSGVALGFKTGQYRGRVYLHMRGWRKVGDRGLRRKFKIHIVKIIKKKTTRFGLSWQTNLSLRPPTPKTFFGSTYVVIHYHRL